jgi:hypothetical protein
VARAAILYVGGLRLGVAADTGVAVGSKIRHSPRPIPASRSARKGLVGDVGRESLVQLGAERDPLDDPLGVAAERAHVSERLLVFEPVGREGALGAGPTCGRRLGGWVRAWRRSAPAGPISSVARGWPAPRSIS